VILLDARRRLDAILAEEEEAGVSNPRDGDLRTATGEQV
jgi:hypothetical protein